MSEKEKGKGEENQALGPSVVLGLVGAVVVLLLLGAGIWGVSKIVSKIRDSRDDSQDEEVAEAEDSTEEDESSEGSESDEGEDGEGDGETSDEGDGDIDGDGEATEPDSGTEEESSSEDEGEGSGEEGDDEEDTESGLSATGGPWVAINYKEGDIEGDSHTVVWGDTLWEIAEARYGSGFEWKKILNANLDLVGYLPNGSRALIIPGQVLTLPE